MSNPDEKNISSVNSSEGEYITYLSQFLNENQIKSNGDLTNLSIDDIFHNLFDLLPVGISFIDENRSITKFNQALLKILQIDVAGLLRGDFAKRKYLDKDGNFIPQSSMPTQRSLQEKIKITNEEIGVITESGQVIWTSVSTTPLPDNRVIAVIQDITEKKKYEGNLKKAHEELLKHQNNLEHLVKERTFELEQTNKRMHTILLAIQQSPDSIVITDKDGIIRYVNPKFSEITGYTYEEAIGKTPSIMKSGKTNPRTYAEMWKTILNGNEWKGNLYNKRKNGEYFWESVHISPVQDISGSIINFIAIKEDVTEKKKKEEQLLKLNRTLKALSHSSDAMIKASNEENYLREIANIIYKDCGHSMVWIGNLEGNDLKTRLSIPKDISCYPRLQKELSEAIKHSSGSVSINRGRSTDQEGPFFSSVLLPLPDKSGEAKEFVSIYSKQNDAFSTEEVDLLIQLIDDLSYGISTLKLRELNRSAEEKLRYQKKELEFLVDELNNSNKQLQDQIVKEKNIEFLLKESLNNEKKLNELKSRFISTTSHEFRTPLTAILSSVQLIQRYRNKWEDEKIEDQFGRVKKSINYLTNLLNDTLTISRAESGKIVFDPKLTDLNKMALDIIEEVKHKCSGSHQIIYNFKSEEHSFHLDEKLLRMILMNLLSNAIKYSPAGGKIRFLVEYDNLVKITISDNGIGIPADEQKHIFTPFFRGRNCKGIEGTGLGLSIIKQSVELHQGSIEFFSKAGKGSKFIVNLPANCK